MMTNPNTPAFPSRQLGEAGLTKRELIATLSLVGILANPDHNHTSDVNAEFAITSADALIKKLNEEVEQ
jgi:hypothetical protein